MIVNMTHKCACSEAALESMLVIPEAAWSPPAHWGYQKLSLSCYRQPELHSIGKWWWYSVMPLVLPLISTSSAFVFHCLIEIPIMNGSKTTFCKLQYDIHLVNEREGDSILNNEHSGVYVREWWIWGLLLSRFLPVHYLLELSSSICHRRLRGHGFSSLKS